MYRTTHLHTGESVVSARTYAAPVLNALHYWLAVHGRDVVLAAAGGDNHLIRTPQYWPKPVRFDTEYLCARQREVISRVRAIGNLPAAAAHPFISIFDMISEECQRAPAVSTRAHDGRRG